MLLTRGKGGYVVVNYKKDKEGYVVIKPIPSLPIVLSYSAAIVRYNPTFFSRTTADRFFEELLTFEKSAQHEKNPFTGKDVERKTLQFSDRGVRVYKYSSAGAKNTLRWGLTSCLQEMRDAIHLATGERPNFCLVNFYSPTAQLGYHSDDEDDMKKDSVVASVSLGTVRRFKLRVKQSQSQSTSTEKTQFIEGQNMWTYMLEHGSLLTMEGKCQSVLQHSVPPMKCEGVRINCTFRRMKMKDCLVKNCAGELHSNACENGCDTLICDCGQLQYFNQLGEQTSGHAPWCEDDS